MLNAKWYKDLMKTKIVNPRKNKNNSKHNQKNRKKWVIF